MSVSILIPAFRPTFLRQALASALTQGLEDFEIVISDDSGGEDVLPVIEQFRDPRIRYLRTAGRIGAAENCEFLWGQARYDLVAYLLDDDLLMPHAFAELVALHRDHPDAAFYFGHRYFIDAAGRITGEPKFLNAEVARLNHQVIAGALVGNVRNPIGEFTNVLINRARGCDVDTFSTYAGVHMRVCSDVAFFLNASRLGPAVGTRKPVAAFRKHGAQNSSPGFNPLFAQGICEWELFIRGEYDAGSLEPAQALAAIDKLYGAYGAWSRSHPEIGIMAPGLKALRGRVEANEAGVLDAPFRAAWRDLEAAVSKRKAAMSAG